MENFGFANRKLSTVYIEKKARISPLTKKDVIIEFYRQ